MAVISLFPEQTSGTISLAPDVKIPQDERIVASRIQKADYALAEASPGQNVIKSAFWSGQEAYIREQARFAEEVSRRRNYIQASRDLILQAAAAGRPLTDGEMAYILNRPEEQILTERTALEQRYARRAVMETLPPRVEDDLEWPEVAEKSTDIIAKQQIAQRVYEDIAERAKDQSWVGWGVDLVKTLVPLYSQVKTSGLLMESDSLWGGENKSEQIRKLYALPTEEFEETLRSRLAQLEEDNPQLAKEFAHQVVAYSASSQFLDSVLTGVDVASIAAPLAGRLLQAGRSARTAKLLIKETARPNMTEADRLVVAGQAKEAAQREVTNRLGEAGVVVPHDIPAAPGVATPLQTLNEASKVGFSIMDPEQFLRGSSSLTNEYQRRLIDSLMESKKILKESVNDLTQVVTTSPEAFRLGVQQAEKSWKKTYFRMEDSIMDIKPVREQDEVLMGVDHIEITVGNKEALPFKSEQQANFWARNIYKVPKDAYRVDQVGTDSYVLRFRKDIDETTKEMYNLRLDTENTTPETMVNHFIGIMRNGSIRSQGATKAAIQSTYSQNVTLNRLEEAARPLSRLGSEALTRLRAILNQGMMEYRTVVDPVTLQPTRVRGRFYNTLAELEQAYMQKGFNLPSFDESAAYFTFRNIMDWDYATRNMRYLRDLARQGVAQHQINWVSVGQDGKKITTKTGWFQGKVLDSLPDASKETYTVAFFHPKTGKNTFKLVGRTWGRERAELQELIDNGYKVLEPRNKFDPELQKIIDTGGEPVQYLLVKESAEKPLNLLNIPYNEGGHWNYPLAGFYLKQPRVQGTKFNRRIYSGDTTAHYFMTRAEATKFQKAYEKNRNLLLQGIVNPDIEKELPYTWDEFADLFKGYGKNPDEGMFNANSPFVLTESGESVSDVVRLQDIFTDREFVDLSRSEHSLMRNVETSYTQSRGDLLTTITDIGSQGSPVFRVDPAPLMDPLESLSRTSTNLIQSVYLDDFKHKAVEDFITQFADVFKPSIEELRADPIRMLQKPEWRDNYPDLAKLATAKNVRRNLLYYLSIDNKEMTAMKYLRQKVADSIYRTVGADSKLLDPWKWDAKTDPWQIMKMGVFHMHQGLLSVVQFPLQAFGVTHTLSIDGNPLRAIQANLLGTLFRFRGLTVVNPKAQGLLSKILGRTLNMTPSQVDEAYDALLKSGMNRFEGEYGKIDNQLNPKMFIQGGVAKGLDAAVFFFREGNLYHRNVSFLTAFLKWRAENPTAKLTASVMTGLKNRAEMMAFDMSRAMGNAVRNKGPLSIPLQYTSFFENLVEQMLGHRLTRAEKLRFLFYNSLIWGVPSTLGVATGIGLVWPVNESVKQYALEHPDQIPDTDVNAWSNFIVNGALQLGTQWLTGENWNVSDRLGPHGFSFLKDALDGKMFDLIGGASGSTLADTYKRLHPFASWISGVFTGDDDYYPLTTADFLDAAREITSFNNLYKAYYAVNAGMFATKDGRPVLQGNYDGFDAAMIGLLGLTPEDVSKVWLQMRSNKDFEEAKAALARKVVENVRRGIKAAQAGNKEEGYAFEKRARALLEGANFSPSEIANLWERALNETLPLANSIAEDFMFVDPENRFQDYKRNLDEHSPY